LHGAQTLSKLIRVKVADGKILEGTKMFPPCEWKCQGNKFLTDFKEFPLDCYDVHIGMDWLEAHSPMRVDWERNWMVVPATW
jgi:hypothetical protein